MSIKKSINSLYSHPYNLNHPFWAILRWTKWNVKKRIYKGPWTEKIWGGKKSHFWPDSDQSMYLARNWVMDWDEFNFIRKYISSSDNVIDVGANIGVYVIWVSQFLDERGKIVAFEPDPVNYERLKAQINLNRIKFARAEKMALSNKKGVLKMSSGKNGENHVVSGKQQKYSHKLNEVKCTILDSYVDKMGMENIDFLKIDVEGFEKYVLEGAKNVLSSDCVDVVQLEVNNQSKKFQIEKTEGAKMLKKFGYDPFIYRHEKNSIDRLSASSLSRKNHINVLFSKNVDKIGKKVTSI